MQAVRSEEVSVVALAQSSAVVQMLLEACHSNYLSATSDEGTHDTPPGAHCFLRAYARFVQSHT